ncbi:hypothetical protein D3C87_1964220 [compost metagenome]
MLGYNDRPDRAPFSVLPVVHEFFESFAPPIAGVDGHVHRIDDGFQHVFVFLRKAKALDQTFRAELESVASAQ